MADVAERGGEPDVAAEGSRLAPLPKRVGAPLTADEAGDAPALNLAPDAYVEELLERAHVLLATLDHDVADLGHDEEELQLRIESDQTRLREEAQTARKQLRVLHEAAEKIARAKGKMARLDEGRHGRGPVDDSVEFPPLLDEIVVEVKAAKGITGAIRLSDIGVRLRQADAVVLRLEQEAEGLRDRQISYVRNERDAETKEARASFEIGTMILNRDIDLLQAALPPAGRPWGHPSWSTWAPTTADDDPATAAWIRAGSFHHHELEADIPLLLELPSPRSLVIDTAGRRDEAIAGVCSLLLRMAAALPPGAVKFTIIDPKGLGQSVAPLLGLAEYDRGLVDGGVATTPDAIDARLTGLTHHAERVVTQYLHGVHRSLADYHAAAGEIVEPYRVLVVLDHPTQLSDTAATQLAALAEHGPRSGVQTILVKDATPSYSSYQVKPPEGSFPLRLDGKGWFLEVPNAGRWEVRLDAPPEIETIHRVVDGVGRGARRQGQNELSMPQLFAVADRAARTARHRDPEPALDPHDPTTWWTGTSLAGVATPIGRLGPAAVAELAFDRRATGYLVLGRPGTGVSNLVHAAVAGLAMRYGPDELELQLIGLGTERDLLTFGELGLPHATVVAIGANHEFAISALESLWAEIERRQDLIAESVGERAGFAGYRAQHDGPLPRVVAVLERVGELFGGTRRQVQRATELLDDVARLGPAAGVHLVLTSSPDDRRVVGSPVPELTTGTAPTSPTVSSAVELRGVAALGVVTLGAAGDVDAGRDGLQIVQRPGDGVVHAAAGPQPFRGAYADPDELTIGLHDLRRLAKERAGEGDPAWPQFHDGHAVARMEPRRMLELVGDPSLREARRMPRLWLGEPVGTGTPVEALVHRRDGANLLAVTADPDLGQGIILAAMLSALLVHGENLGVLALDFMSPDAGFTDATKALAAGGWTVQLARRRNITKVVDLIHRVVQDRLATSETRAKPVLFVLNGLSRARDLDVAADGETHPDDEHLLGIIEAVLRDGPEVGVHTLAWCESTGALSRRLPKSAIREFALRVAGPMEADESVAFIDTDQAAGMRANEALFADEDSGQLVKMRPYTLPSLSWLEAIVARATT